MQTRSVLITSLLVAAMVGAGATSAADNRDTPKNPAAPQHSTPNSGQHDAPAMQGRGGMTRDGGGMMGGMGGMMKDGGGMMGGMAGMMDMMNGCSQMMSGSTTPHLPAGNEKLQLRMQAEIMQKTAEILAKYADQIGAGGK